MPSNSSGSTKPLFDPFGEFLAQFVTDQRLEVIERRLQFRTRHLTIALEGLRGTHNTSACLRSCDGFGIQDVHLIEKQHRYRVNRDIERGSAQWLTLIRHATGVDNFVECMRSLRESGYRIVATSPRADAVALEDFDVTQKSTLFFGCERDGLSDIVMNEADDLLRIPMYGFAESFNISVAVAICLHHLTWKLRTANVLWRLTEKEQSALRSEWLKLTIGHRLPQLEREYRRRM